MRTKLLIIVDMQNDFIDGVLGTYEAKALVPKMVDYIKNWDGDIILTQDTHDENYLNTIEGKKLPVRHCIEGTIGWNINKEVDEAITNKVGDKSIVRFSKSTFGSNELRNYIFLGESRFSEIYFCGVCTGICVLSNAILVKSAVPNTHIFVIEDLCACVTPESHKIAIEAMKMCHIDIVSEAG